jgi:hypothetical protein
VKKEILWRLVGGVIVALLLSAGLILHITGVLKLDEISLALLLGIVGSIVFALSQQLGIAKISAGLLEVEIGPLVERAILDLDIPTGQTEDVRRILQRHADLFPVTGVRLLWIDDRPESLIPQRRLLRRIGIEVVSAISTRAAVDELKRDGDFVMIVQDHLRDGYDDNDAKDLVKWVDTDGPTHGIQRVPLIVFSLDSFDESIGVQEQNWIEKDFAALLGRITIEIQQWKKHSPTAQDKPPT